MFFGFGKIALTGDSFLYKNHGASSIIPGLLNQSSGGSTPPAVQDYYLRTIIPNDDPNPPFPETDGCAMISYNGEIYKSLGWSGNNEFFPWKSSDRWQKTSDNGLTFTDIDPMPFHSHGFGVRVKDGKIWIWGMAEDMASNPTGVFLATYDTVNGWVSITSDAGLPLAIAAFYTEINGEMYMLGGQNNINTSTPIAYNTVYKINEDGTTVFVGNTPVPFMTASTGWVNGSYFYFTGGGELSDDPNGYNALVSFIYRTPITSPASTWTIYTSLPVALQGIWQDALIYDGRIWWSNGYYEGANKQGLYYTANNGSSWTYQDNSPSPELRARHLTAMAVHNDCLYFAAGNGNRDFLRIEKVTYPSFAASDIKLWWQRLWPDKRPTQPELDDINDVVTYLLNTPTPSNLSNHWDELDVFNLGAGYENYEQFAMYLKTPKTSFYNTVEKINTPDWAYGGVNGALPSGSPAGSIYDQNYRIFVDNVKFTQNSSSLGCISLENIDEDIFDFGGLLCGIAVSQANNRFYGNLFCNTQASLPVTSAKGFRSLLRTDSSNYSLIVDEDAPVSFSSTSQSVDNNTYYCGYVFTGNNYPGVKKMGGWYYSSGDVDPQVYRTAFYMFYNAVQSRTGIPIL